MPRYIDAEEAEEILRTWDMQDLYLPIHFKDFVLDETQTANVQEVKHGQFVKQYDELDIDRGWMCSNCRNSVYSMTFEPYHFCPHCGAKMDGDKDGK